jgi:hypothetical protein
MSRFRNAYPFPAPDRCSPARDRSHRRNVRFAPEWLERRLSPSSIDGVSEPPALVESENLSDSPEPDPLDPPPQIPPYEPPVPPGGPNLPD